MVKYAIEPNERVNELVNSLKQKDYLSGGTERKSSRWLQNLCSAIYFPMHFASATNPASSIQHTKLFHSNEKCTTIKPEIFFIAHSHRYIALMCHGNDTKAIHIVFEWLHRTYEKCNLLGKSFFNLKVTIDNC